MDRLTNVEFITEAMEFSDFGALAQVFILHAVDTACKKVADTPLDVLKAQWGDNPFIMPEAWQGVAKELQEKFKHRKV